jgi:hypothetical protein
MTVRELIEFLKTCSPDDSVCVEPPDPGYLEELVRASNMREDRDQETGQGLVVIS